VTAFRFIPPCSPIRAKEVPAGDGWVHEVKFDGYRVQAHKVGPARCPVQPQRARLHWPLPLGKSPCSLGGFSFCSKENRRGSTGLNRSDL